MYGIDVADTDGSVNWAEVKNSSKTFAFVKATEGKTLKDSSFSHHWPIIKQYAIARGAYHYFTMTSDPKDQANEFLKTMGKLEPGDLPPVLDVERTYRNGKEVPIDPSSYVDHMQQWLAVVEQALIQQTGKKIKPIIYTGPSFWTDALGDPREFGDYPLWIANYDVPTPSVPLCWGQGNWLIHQYKGDVPNVPGVSDRADLDRFNSFQQGAKGSIVKGIQQRLKNLTKPEFDPGNLDGNFTLQTEKAIMAFQKSNNLQVDGIVSLKTWLQLLWA